MFVPGSNESRCAHARIRVSWTRSLARSTSPHSEIANARRLGTAASIAPRTSCRASSRSPMTSALLVARFVEALEELGKPLWDALTDDIRVHGTKLLPDLVLDFCTEPALLLLAFFSFHRGVRGLSQSVVHFIVPPDSRWKTLLRDGRFPVF